MQSVKSLLNVSVVLLTIFFLVGCRPSSINSKENPSDPFGFEKQADELGIIRGKELKKYLAGNGRLTGTERQLIWEASKRREFNSFIFNKYKPVSAIKGEFSASLTRIEFSYTDEWIMKEFPDQLDYYDVQVFRTSDQRPTPSGIVPPGLFIPDGYVIFNGSDRAIRWNLKNFQKMADIAKRENVINFKKELPHMDFDSYPGAPEFIAPNRYSNGHFEITTGDIPTICKLLDEIGENRWEIDQEVLKKAQEWKKADDLFK